MSDKSDNPPSPDGQNLTGRKITKPLMEKRRRARINSCLSDLKTLLLTDADEKESGRFAKLEKADILEMTVKYLRNQQSSSNDGQQTALYRAGFNKCMEELTAFLGVNDEQSANLRLKLTEHLAEILCCLKDTGTKCQSERSNVSPGFHVSSSSDEPTSVPVARLTQSPSDPASGSPRQIRTACNRSTASPVYIRSGATVSNVTLPQGVNPDSQSPRMTFSLASDQLLSSVGLPMSSYTTIPVLPTVVTPGQVLLLVPNNNGGGFHLPTFNASSLEQLKHTGDYQAITLNGSPVKLEQFNASTAKYISSLQEVKISPQPVLGSAQQSCATVVKSETPSPEKSLSNFGTSHSVHSKETESVSDCDQEEQNSPDSRVSLAACRVRNGGANGNSLVSNCAMWRPW